jgi:hypothetical protein
MSDIKEIIPENDWRKVKIQDFPAEPTAQNVPSQYFFNGISDAVKELEKHSVEVIYPTLYSGWSEYSPNFQPLTIVRDGKKRTLYGSINGSNAANKYICGMVSQDRPSKHVFASSFVNDGGSMVGQLTIATNGDINVTPFKHTHIAINISWYVD